MLHTCLSLTIRYYVRVHVPYLIDANDDWEAVTEANRLMSGNR